MNHATQEPNYNPSSFEHIDHDPLAEPEILPVLDLNQFQPSITKAEDIAASIVQVILEGKVNPLEFAIKRKCIEDAFEMVLAHEDVRKQVIEQVESYGKGGAKLLGATVRVQERGKYQYEQDATWKALTDSIEDTVKAIKDQETKIQAATKAKANLVDEDGTIIAQAVAKKTTDVIMISFK